MEQTLPKCTHVYQNHHLDGTRWVDFVPRSDDVIIATAYKCGTTWMQGIVSCLILGECQLSASPWLDWRSTPLENVMDQLTQQAHRRFIKTHMPLDGLPYFPQVRYIVVSRDPRDVFMSLWNHYSNYTAAAYAEVNNFPGRVGPPLPVCPANLGDFWRVWITCGWFEWESEGYPFWSNMRHVQTWWNFRYLPNILFVHYNHLKADPAGQIQRLARFLEIPLAEDALPGLIESTSLDAMRQQALAGEADRKAPSTFKEGARTFFYKGTNERWKEALTVSDLVLYERAAGHELTPECRAWLEEGRF